MQSVTSGLAIGEFGILRFPPERESDRGKVSVRRTNHEYQGTHPARAGSAIFIGTTRLISMFVTVRPVVIPMQKPPVT
jgi:hypothetical protein